MAKINTKLIENYDQMTTEQKLAALEALDQPDPDLSGYVRKDLYDKAASDAAAWKKKHNELLTEDERKKQEQADSLSAMQRELEELRKDKQISEYTARFVGLGYDEALAKDTAAAMAAGDSAKVFANQAKFNEAYAKKVKADTLGRTPRPNGGADTGTTGQDFGKMIEAANARNDYAAVAYYTRLQAQAEAQNQNNQ